MSEIEKQEVRVILEENVKKYGVASEKYDEENFCLKTIDLVLKLHPDIAHQVDMKGSQQNDAYTDKRFKGRWKREQEAFVPSTTESV